MHLVKLNKRSKILFTAERYNIYGLNQLKKVGPLRYRLIDVYGIVDVELGTQQFYSDNDNATTYWSLRQREKKTFPCQ